jgi:hypothetical protein
LLHLNGNQTLFRDKHPATEEVRDEGDSENSISISHALVFVAAGGARVITAGDVTVIGCRNGLLLIKRLIESKQRAARENYLILSTSIVVH